MSQAVDSLLLESLLKQLKLSTFIENHSAFASDAAQTQQSYTRYLVALAEQEVQARQTRRRQRRLKEAKLPVVKDMTTFDFSAIPQLNEKKILQLAQGEFIDRKESIILVGNPGLGKTHVASALTVAAAQQMRRVRFFNTAALVTELIQAQQEQRLTQYINRMLNYQLLVFDELGFIPFTTTGAQLMFQLCSALYERVALIITTNLAFSDWTQVFGDERLTVALLDRLTHKAHIIEFVGESFRFRQRLQQTATEPMPAIV